MTNKKEQNSMSEKPQHSLYNRYKTQLISLRAQGMQISDINPVSALADMISDQLYHGQLERGELKALIGDITQNVWQKQASELAGKTNLSDFDPAFKAVRGALSGCDMTKPLYRAVFTAHPVFALQKLSQMRFVMPPAIYQLIRMLCRYQEGLISRVLG